MMNIIHYLHCPLCGSHRLSHYLTSTDHLVSHNNFEILRCNDCNFLFTQDVPSPQAIGAYYESLHYSPHHAMSGLMGSIYVMARRVMLRRKAQMVHLYATHTGTLLDIGAGCGHFLSLMQKRGWMVAGCEQSETARQMAQSLFGLSLAGDVWSAQYDTGAFDVITLWHAMEHIHDLHGLWSRLRQWLAADGTLVVAVPNCSSADARHYGCNWAAWDVPRHLWHFSPDAFSALAAQHGFRVVAIHRLPLDVYYISLMSEQYRNEKFGLLSAIWHSLLFNIRSTFHIQETSSLIYILRRW